MKKHGFTLVELLVTIAIIGVFVCLLLPAILQAIQASRDAAKGKSNNTHGTATSATTQPVIQHLAEPIRHETVKPAEAEAAESMEFDRNGYRYKITFEDQKNPKIEIMWVITPLIPR